MIIGGKQLETGVRATLRSTGAHAEIKTDITGTRHLVPVQEAVLVVEFAGPDDEVITSSDATHILGLLGTEFSCTFTGIMQDGSSLTAARCTITDRPQFDYVGRSVCRYNFSIVILSVTA